MVEVLVAVFPVVAVQQVPGNEIMNIETFFNSEEKELIKQTISKAESHTSAEIVPVVTESSGRYDRAEDLAGCTIALAALSLVWFGFQGVSFDGDWQNTSTPELAVGLGSTILTLIAAFVAGVFLANRFWGLRRLFCRRSEMEACLKERAIQAFQMHRVGSTQQATGVLIFISAFERMVYVMGDSSISKQFSNADFEEVKDAIIDGFKDRKYGKGLAEGIQLCGQKLKGYFPRDEDDKDELSNDLILWKQNL